MALLLSTWPTSSYTAATKLVTKAHVSSWPVHGYYVTAEWYRMKSKLQRLDHKLNILTTAAALYTTQKCKH